MRWNPKLFGYGAAAMLLLGLSGTLYMQYKTIESKDDEISDLKNMNDRCEFRIEKLRDSIDGLEESLREQNEEVEKWKDRADEKEQEADERVKNLREDFEDRVPVETEDPKELNEWLDNLFTEQEE